VTALTRDVASDIIYRTVFFKLLWTLERFLHGAVRIFLALQGLEIVSDKRYRRWSLVVNGPMLGTQTGTQNCHATWWHKKEKLIAINSRHPIGDGLS